MTGYAPHFGDYPASPRTHAYPPYRESAKGLPCAVCGARPTLRTVGKLAYCKRHKAEAQKAAETMMGVRR